MIDHVDARTLDAAERDGQLAAIEDEPDRKERTP
jgi:hypothetical protein